MIEQRLPAKEKDPRGKAARGTALLSLRQVLVGAITVAGIIALPLLLGPADFSLYGYVNMIVLLGAAVGDLGLGAYLIKHDVTKRQLRGMLGLQLLFWIGTALVLMAIALTFDPFGFSALTYTLLCTGLVVFALQSLPTALMERRLAFRQISLLEVVQRVVLVSVAIGFAIFEPSEWAIPLAALVAAVLLYPIFFRLSNWPGPPLLIRGEPVFRGFASDWWQTRIANQMAYSAFPLLGGLLFSAEQVGLLIWALSISLIPGYLAPMAARAIYPVMAKAKRADRIAIHELVLRGLLLVGTPIVVVMFVCAAPVTQEVFGQPWTDAVPALQVLLLSSLLGVALATTVPLAFLEGSTNTVKWFSAISTLLVFLIGFALSSHLSLLSLPIASLSSGLLLLLALDRLVHRSDSYSPLRVCIPAVVGLVIGLPAGFTAISLLGEGPLALVGIAFLAVALQTGITWSLGGGISIDRIREELRSVMQGNPGIS